MPSALSCFNSGAARSRLAWNTSDDFGVTLSMCDLRLQGFVNVVALPAGFLVVDLHVERQAEFAGRKDRIEIGRQGLEDMLAGGLSGSEIAPLAEPQHHGEETELRRAVGDGIVLAANGADADAAERKNSGLDRSLAHEFDDLAHIDAGVEIGGILDRVMRHLRPPDISFFSSTSGEIAADRSVGAIILSLIHI